MIVTKVFVRWDGASISHLVSSTSIHHHVTNRPEFTMVLSRADKMHIHVDNMTAISYLKRVHKGSHIRFQLQPLSLPKATCNEVAK